jgi:hypothetical protein
MDQCEKYVSFVVVSALTGECLPRLGYLPVALVLQQSRASPDITRKPLIRTMWHRITAEVIFRAKCPVGTASKSDAGGDGKTRTVWDSYFGGSIATPTGFSPDPLAS